MRVEKIEEYAEKAKMNSKELLLFIWNSVVFIHLAILIIRYIYGWFMLQKYIISNNPVYLVLSVLPLWSYGFIPLQQTTGIFIIEKYSHP